MNSPRDRFLTVMGRKPVIEALQDDTLEIDKILLSTSAQGPEISTINGIAASRKITIERVKEAKVTAVARNGKHHQGVVADVVAPAMQHITDFCEQRRRGKDWACNVLVLDAVHNPSNVGMILRSATAAGFDGIVVPHKGTASVGPITIKASAGVAFRAPILRSDDTAEALDVLIEHRFEMFSLDADGRDLFSFNPPERAAYIIGNETTGPSADTNARVRQRLTIPMYNGVESLNAAVAASLLCYSVRGSHSTQAPTPTV